MRLLFVSVLLLISAAARVSAYELVLIEQISGGSSWAPTLSSDGRVVIGRPAGNFDLKQLEPIRWTRESGAVRLGQLAGYGSTGASDVSADGAVVVGRGVPEPYEAFRWTAQDGMVGLGPVPGQLSSGSIASAVSGDGSTVVGHNGNFGEGFVWTAQDGMVAIGAPSGLSDTYANDVSADGGVVAMTVDYFDSSGAYDTTHAALWTRHSGFQDLGPLPVEWNTTSAIKLTADGKTLLGRGGRRDAIGTRSLFLWAQDKGIVPLPTLMGGGYLSPHMTPDASVVVANEGNSVDGLTPVVWDEQHGMRRLYDTLVTDHAFAQPEGFMSRVLGISADQMTLLLRSGTSNDAQAWILYLDKPLVTPVPEPASWMIVLVGFVAIAALRPRWRHGRCTVVMA